MQLCQQGVWCGGQIVKLREQLSLFFGAALVLENWIGLEIYQSSSCSFDTAPGLADIDHSFFECLSLLSNLKSIAFFYVFVESMSHYCHHFTHALLLCGSCSIGRGEKSILPVDWNMQLPFLSLSTLRKLISTPSAMRDWIRKETLLIYCQKTCMMNGTLSRPDVMSCAWIWWNSRISGNTVKISWGFLKILDYHRQK